MELTTKKSKKIIGSIIMAAAGIICLIARIAMGVEMQGIESASAQIVQVGSKSMLKAEYLEYAASLNGKVTVAAVICFVVAIVLFILYCMQKKKNNA